MGPGFAEAGTVSREGDLEVGLGFLSGNDVEACRAGVESGMGGKLARCPGGQKLGSHLLAGLLADGGEPQGLLNRGLRCRLEGGFLGTLGVFVYPG